MYKIKLICSGLSQEAGPSAAIDITKEFAFRPWQKHAVCTWSESSLILELENDFDEDGLASVDEFSDAISAYVSEGFDGDILVVSISKF